MGSAADPISFYCFQTKHLLRDTEGRRGWLLVTLSKPEPKSLSRCLSAGDASGGASRDNLPFWQNIFHEARQAVSGERKCFPRGNLPFWQNIFHEARQAGSGGRRRLLVVIFPSGKTSATEAPPVSACEAGGRCRCAQFRDIRLIGMLLGCLEGLPVWRVFCWKPLSSSVIMSLQQICTRHGSKASIQDGRTGKLKNLIKNFPSLICFCPTQPCRLHRLTVQSVSLTDTGPSSFAAATVCTG